MTESEKEKLHKILYQLKYITDSEEKDPFVGIYFSDLIDLLEDYKLVSYDIDKIRNNKKILLTAADRGKIDEIIMALTTLGEEKMINYNEEIDFLNNIRKL